MVAYTGFYVFGDSLVDAGNALALAEWYGTLTASDLPDGAPTAEQGYYDGRFTNGYTFADLLSNKFLGLATEPVFPYGYEDPWLDIPIAPFASDPSGHSLNFAYGGAQIRRGNEVVPDLDGQTDAFKDAVDGRADPNALYLVTIGGNDVRSLVPSGSDPVPVDQAHATLDAAASKMLTELRQIVEIGVTNIVITGIPDVGLIPKYDVDGNNLLEGDELVRANAASDYSAYLDALIRELVVPGLQAIGANVTYVPIADIEDAAGNVVFPGALSLNLPTLAALNGLTATELSQNLLEHQEVVFFDQIHPTAQAHALLGAYMHSLLEGSPWVERLPLTGVSLNALTAGTISTVGEVDRLVVSLVAGTTYTLEMLGISSLAASGSIGDPMLRLLAANGSLAGSSDDDGAGFDSTLTFVAPATGNYVIELSGVGSMTGAYAFQGGVVGGTAMTQANSYTVNSSTAIVMEGVGGVGADVVRASVSYALAGGSEIETLRTTNDKSKGSINLTGNDFAQTVIGNGGSNRIDGKGGNDSLWGLAGKDTFVFTSAIGVGNTDSIRDFKVRDDTIALDDAIFTALAAGKLTSGAFARGTVATQADDRIIYDPGSGKLFYDADGLGGAAQIHFATLATSLAVSAADFIVI